MLVHSIRLNTDYLGLVWWSMHWSMKDLPAHSSSWVWQVLGEFRSRWRSWQCPTRPLAWHCAAHNFWSNEPFEGCWNIKLGLLKQKLGTTPFERDLNNRPRIDVSPSPLFLADRSFTPVLFGPAGFGDFLSSASPQQSVDIVISEAWQCHSPLVIWGVSWCLQGQVVTLLFPTEIIEMTILSQKGRFSFSEVNSWHLLCYPTTTNYRAWRVQ